MSSNGKPAISQAGSGLPSRVIFHGLEGVGKTSLFAYSTKPIFAMTRGETGLLTLIDNGLIPPTDHFNEIGTWADLLSVVRYLIEEDRPTNRTFVLDTLNGAERLCFEHVTRTMFQGDWEKFTSYGKGPDVAQGEWLLFLGLLDKLRAVRRMSLALLTHTRVKTFKNPEGDDYDRYVPDMHEKTWGLSLKWADIVLFGSFETFAKKNRGELKAKGTGGQNRILYTTRTAAWDAKNRCNLPPEIVLGQSAQEGWESFLQAVKQGRKNVQPSATIVGSLSAEAVQAMEKTATASDTK